MSLQRNVIRRNGTYYFRIAIPSNLVDIMGRRDLWRSLRTKDAGTARVRAAVAQIRALNHFSRLHRMAVFDREQMSVDLQDSVNSNPEAAERQRVSAAKRALISDRLPDEAIQDAVADFYRTEMQAEEEWRVSDRPDVDLELDSFDWPFLESYGEDPAEVRRYCSSHQVKMADLVRYEDAQAQIEHFQDRLNKGDWQAGETVVRPFLEQRSLIDAVAEIDYRLLCHRMLHAYCEALKTRIAWFEGNWGFKPRNPFISDRSLGEVRTANNPVRPQANRPEGKGLVSTLISKFLAEKSNIDPKSAKEQRATMVLLEEWVGSDRHVDSYGKDDVVGFKDALMVLPLNFKKFFPGISIREAIALNETAGRKTLAGSPTLQRKIDQVRRFFDWAVINNLCVANPAAGLKVIAGRKNKRTDRRPFDVEELTRLFALPLFTGCASSRGWKELGTFRIRDHRYWLPLLALWMGARQGELAQLLVSDVKMVDGIDVVSITATDDEPDATSAMKKVKTESSVRLVPVHPELRQLGFLDYVTDARASGYIQLFPQCERGVDGSFSPYSKHFRHVREAAKITRKGVVYHSFRHSFEDAMRSAGLDLRVCAKLTGRELDHSSEDYGDGFKPSTLYEYLKRVVYPGLNLSHLYTRQTDEKEAKS